MCPEEFWTIYYGKIDRQKQNAGQLTDGDYDELLEMLKKAKNG